MVKKLEIIRKVGDFSLVKKGNHYYIDNGIDDVSEYFDKIEADEVLKLKNAEFINYCLDLF